MKKALLILDRPWALIFLFLGPVVVKWLVSGQLGPAFHFYFVFAWLPILSLLYSLRFGIKMVLATVVIYSVAAGLLYLNYTADAPMNFQRQMIFDGTPVMAIAFAMTFVGQIAFKFSQRS